MIRHMPKTLQQEAWPVDPSFRLEARHYDSTGTGEGTRIGHWTGWTGCFGCGLIHATNDGADSCYIVMRLVQVVDCR